jgi:hypothetical protein
MGRCYWLQAMQVLMEGSLLRSKIMTAFILADVFCAVSPANIQPVFLDTQPAPASARSRQVVRRIPASAVAVKGVPKSTWTYGCAATAGGMIFGYYDRNGYPDMYTGRKSKGVAPLRNLGRRTNLIATKKGRGKNGSFGHVDDYWTGYGQSGPDPYVINGRQEHTWDCVADFLGTNQWKWDFYGDDGIIDFNIDGSTALWAYNTSGEKLYDYVPSASAGLPQTSFCHGLKLYAESRGYSVSENYTQKIDTLFEDGFSFEDFQDEIDAGCPVVIQLQGHSMVGVGYDDADSIIYVHDTWDNRLHWMEWGQSYAGMTHIAVTVLHLDVPSVEGLTEIALQPSGQMFTIPEPAVITFLLLGVMLLRNAGHLSGNRAV